MCDSWPTVWCGVHTAIRFPIWKQGRIYRTGKCSLTLEHDGVCFLADFNARTGVVDGIITGGLKGTGPRRFGKKQKTKKTLFYVRSLCSINFCSGSVEMRQFKNNCSGLKIDRGSPHGCSYLRNAYYVITFCCFTQMFVDSAYKHDDGVVSCT